MPLDPLFKEVVSIKDEIYFWWRGWRWGYAAGFGSAIVLFYIYVMLRPL